MKKINILFLITMVVCTSTKAQNLLDIFTEVDTLFIPNAAPGHLFPLNGTVTPIVSSTPCNIPLKNFSVATQYQDGRVLAIAHEGLLANGNIAFYDNLKFLTNAFNWLNPGNKEVKLKEGWITNNNSSTLQNTLMQDDYSFNTLTGSITSASLANTDILILGNDWNGVEPYTASELSALETFVADGGAILIAGLGWSWPEDLSQYPMNAVANLFGFEFTTETISDNLANINGSPKMYNFYPDNINTTETPYCPSPFFGTNFGRGDNLRIFRLAVSTMGEFTEQNGGVSTTSELINEWLAEINTIYGREYCVRFELIPNNEELVFADPDTDPWNTLPPGSGGCTNAGIILNEQANVIDNIIGAANYDISHVIVGSPFNGGCASGLKSAISGELDIPITQHEMGHQFSQSHTINHPNNVNYEPENGAWTIQGGNAQSHGHAVSFHQLANFLANTIPSIGMNVSTGNTIPIVNAGLDYTIPISTPFTLTGMVDDTGPNDEITYVWDNMSPGIPQSIPVLDDSQGAIFMRLLPSVNASRTFPEISDVIANNNVNSQEQLPSQARIMDIRLTANDNYKMMYNGELVNASGSHSDDLRLTVVDDGPFVVTSQSTNGILYLGGTTQLITWDVNGTNELPINTQNVTISISTDGGFTYPTILSPSTPNDGSAMVILPNITTQTARIKVAAIDNIYFDINSTNFAIEFTTASSNIELNDSTCKIYPNPTSDFFKIYVPNQLNYQAKLYDAKGLILVEQVNENHFDISKYANGLYFLEVMDLDSNQRITKKIIKLK